MPNHFALARLNSNGTLDITFNGDGELVTDFGTASATREDSAGAIAIQRNDGRIVVAGASRPTSSGGRSSFGVARYHAFTCNGANVTILGTNGPDTIFGTPFNDVIHGLGGDDIIDGGDGNDSICGGDGNDTLIGGLGSDVLIGGPIGFDVMNGGKGTDVCVGSQAKGADLLDSFILCESVNTGLAGLSGEWVKVEQNCNQSIPHPSCVLNGSLRVFNPGSEGDRRALAGGLLPIGGRATRRERHVPEDDGSPGVGRRRGTGRRVELQAFRG